VNLKLFGEIYVTLLVIVDPPGMVPVFLALTGALPPRERVRAGTQAVALALGVIVVFAVAGQTLLDYLHVQLPALQGAGGLLLVLVALQLLTGKTDAPEELSGTSNVALVPLGTPLLAGPARSWRRCCSRSVRTVSPTT
jgi:multiple antibiotic resistance protein